MGNIGKHLDTTYQLQPGGAGNRVPSTIAGHFSRCVPRWRTSTGPSPTGPRAYHALQFTVQKRLTHGLNGLLSYTWSHGIDTVGQSFGGGADGPLPQDPLNRLASQGNSPFDIRHRLTIAWNYALPGGWQINGINTFQTGLPFTPTLNTTTINTGTGQRPDRVGDGKLSDPTVDRWFDTSAFTTPAPFTYGNAGRKFCTAPAA